MTIDIDYLQTGPSYRYEAYSIPIESDIELPDLTGSSQQKASKSTLRIRRAKIDTQWRDDIDKIQIRLLSDQEFYLSVPGTALYLVRNGNEIILQPHTNANYDSVRLYLIGTALSIILFQRNYLVLHGNAIKIDDKCLVCVGDSGAGKSTIAAAFHQMGYQLLADDVVPVDSSGRALPGFPRIKLSSESADLLHINTSSLNDVAPEVSKFNMPIDRAGHELNPIEIGWIYELNTFKRSAPTITLVEGLERYQTILRNTHRVEFMHQRTLMTEHLARGGRLASTVVMKRFFRPASGVDPLQCANAILTDISGIY